jgi:ferredoxin
MTVMSRDFNKNDFSDPVRAAEIVKKEALQLGADCVGIGNIERWEGVPLQMDPKQIMPECKSIIAMAFRVNRGSLRGIEEGTFFSNYSSMGYGAITFLFWPIITVPLSKLIEDHGYEAVPYGHLNPWEAQKMDGSLMENHSRPAATGRASPDVTVHLRIAAYLCGLGEIGFSKIFLTPQFGPRNRIGIVLTDAELAPDPIYSGHKLCNRCLKCVRACPGGAFDPKRTVKVKLAGNEVEWLDVDLEKCTTSFWGVERCGSDVPENERYCETYPDSRPSSSTLFNKCPQPVFNYGRAICGGKGCMRACMISLEERNALENRFKQKFRRRPQWEADWSKPPPGSNNV